MEREKGIPLSDSQVLTSVYMGGRVRREAHLTALIETQQEQQQEQCRNNSSNLGLIDPKLFFF